MNESLDSASASVAARDYQTCPGEQIYARIAGVELVFNVCVRVYVCACKFAEVSAAIAVTYRRRNRALSTRRRCPCADLSTGERVISPCVGQSVLCWSRVTTQTAAVKRCATRGRCDDIADRC